MSASGRFAFFAWRTSQGSENPPLLIATWQFWQRSTVSDPQEFLRFAIQYCSICGSLPSPLNACSRLSRSWIGFSMAAIQLLLISRSGRSRWPRR